MEYIQCFNLRDHLRFYYKGIRLLFFVAQLRERVLRFIKLMKQKINIDIENKWQTRVGHVPCHNVTCLGLA